MKNGKSRALPIDAFGPVGPAVGRYRNIAPNVAWSNTEQSSPYYFVDEPTDKYAESAELATVRGPRPKYGYGAVPTNGTSSNNLWVVLGFAGVVAVLWYLLVKK